MKTCIVVFIAMLALLPQVSAGDETPTEGLRAIADLYAAKDFDTLIRHRYTEIYKAEAVGKVDELVRKFTQRFSSPRKLRQVTQMFELFASAEPRIATNPKPRETETDKMAIFKTEQGEYTLYLQKSGQWGFHL